MKTTFLLLVVLLAAPQGGGGHFSKEGLAFDYPAGWTLAETGDAQIQRLMLTRAGGGTNVIIVFAQRELITTAAQLYRSRTAVTMPYVTNIANRLGLERPPPSDAQCVNVGGRPAVGFRMSGIYEGQPTTAEVYTVTLGQRLLHLVHLRADKDEAASAAAWKTVLDSLRVDAPAQPSPEADRIEQIVSGGVLNGRATKKPQPDYPSTAKASRAQGVVVVQILVDEKGQVANAQAVSGHQLLRGASEDAARRAKFEVTTLCGRPVKVSGIITYNFVLR
jgi:TonB family protein